MLVAVSTFVTVMGRLYSVRYVPLLHDEASLSDESAQVHFAVALPASENALALTPVKPTGQVHACAFAQQMEFEEDMFVFSARVYECAGGECAGGECIGGECIGGGFEYTARKLLSTCVFALDKISIGRACQ